MHHVAILDTCLGSRFSSSWTAHCENLQMVIDHYVYSNFRLIVVKFICFWLFADSTKFSKYVRH